jgi:outer membrane receptor protein involved in Fe transport
MKKFGLLATSAIGSAALFSLAFAAPAYAQGTAVQDEEAEEQVTPQGEVEAEGDQALAEEEADDQAITVTGSRIRRPTLDSNVPITSVSPDDIIEGNVNVGDALNDLPSLRSTFSQANSTRFIGTAGLNFLDLRGLSPERTLVLVNGRRHVGSSAGDFRVDVNTIPEDLIERIDIITGGSSAVYGADAVAGVVNFVLKRDFDGFRLRGQAGVSSRGDRGIQFISGTAGRNFADGRGNVAVNVEYVNAEPYYYADREDFTGAFGGPCGFQLAEPTAGEPATGDDTPDNQFFCGLRSTAISTGGLINALNPSILIGGVPTAVACTNATLAPGGANAAIGAARCVNPGTPLGQLRQFSFGANSQLNESILSTDLRPFGAGFSVGGLGATVSETGQLAPGLDRFSANLVARFDVSDFFRPFLEAKYVHLRSLQEGQATFFQGSIPGFFGGGANLRCNNPFLPAQALAQLQAVGRCANVNTGTILISRFNTDFGGRGEINKRDTYRFLAGFEGDFNEDWRYEVSFNYGRTDAFLLNQNDLYLFDENGNDAGFLLAANAVKNGSGQIVCAVNADADTTNDAPGCIPINLFGQQAFTPEQLAFINTNTFLDETQSQYNAVAFVNGDLSQLFELPGGPVRFVLGAEYRRETAHSVPDEVSAAGRTFFNAFAEFDPPAFEVKEAFGEIEIPFLRDRPFFHELTLTGAARYSDYNKGAGQVGSTFTYNVNGTWAPIPDIRLRANYSKSVRVPTPGDLFSPQTQGFAFVQDPCDVLFINAGPNRAANCVAIGLPATGIVNTPVRTQTIGFTSGGNPLLSEETGRSLTLGAIFQPRFVPGLSITVDYYDITVDNLIATLGAAQILNLCFDQTTIDNQFCAQITSGREQDNPATPDVNETGFFSDFDNVLTAGGVNFAKFVARGVDVDVAYRRTFSNGHRLSLRGIATYVLERTNFTNPTDPTFGNRILSELGDPVFSANFAVGYGIGNLDLRYSLNYIGRQTISTYEATNEFEGRPPTNADILPQEFYPDIFYHAARVQYKVNDKYRMYFGVDNITDRKPPLGSYGVGAGSAIFDNVGRYFYVGAQIDF